MAAEESQASNSSSNASLSLNIEATAATAFNAYGSPVHGQVADQPEPANVAPNPEQESPAENQRVRCACKNTCSRKRTAKTEGCPCRNLDEKCSSACTCGTTKKLCKNKAVEGGTEVRQNRAPSAQERFQQDLQTARKAIEEFVTPLSPDMKTTLLIRLLSQGRGSLDYAQNLVSDLNNTNPPQPEPPVARLPWCICSVCKAMPNDQENKCCNKVRCVTSYQAFHNQCIDHLSLTLAIRQRCDMRADLPDYSVNSYRKAAYRTYIIWKYGKLGRGNRKVVPSCVVRMVRRAYPSPDNIYMGYRVS